MRKFAASALMVAMLALPHGAMAGATVEEAKTFVSNVGASALTIIKESGSKQQKAKKLEKLFSDSVDVPWVGRFVLGRFWRTATPEQQKKYITSYEEFLVTHYAGRFSEYSGGEFKVTEANQDEDGNFLVNMRIMSPENQEVIVDYRVHATDGGKLKIYDVVVEGVSMIQTQRSEFGSVLAARASII